MYLFSLEMPSNCNVAKVMHFYENINFHFYAALRCPSSVTSMPTNPPPTIASSVVSAMVATTVNGGGIAEQRASDAGLPP